MINGLELSEKLQKLNEIDDIFEIYGKNLNNMDPDQLKILELDFSECFKGMGV
ncbi:hypothetical protein J4209_02880 [Candidatus Woesearchaeota archaeon]|nr:hypothetical protein [Candidatus Woesearchaeota archaeon]